MQVNGLYLYHLIFRCPQSPQALKEKPILESLAQNLDRFRRSQGAQIWQIYFEHHHLDILLGLSDPLLLEKLSKTLLRQLTTSLGSLTQSPPLYFWNFSLERLRSLEQRQSIPFQADPLPTAVTLLPQRRGSASTFAFRAGTRILWPEKRVLLLHRRPQGLLS